MHPGSRWPAAMVVMVLVACTSPATAPPADTATPQPTAAASVPAPSPSIASSAAALPSAEPPEPLAWRQLEASGPAAREDHTWTVDGGRRTAFLFGGRDGLEVFGDLWAYDLASDTWSRVDTTRGPAPRFGHEAAWVDDVGLVVFAGQSGPTFFNDLWAFDPEAASWRQLPSDGDVPVARYGTCAAIGPDGRLWISHGFTSDGTRFADTRAYDFTAGAWTDETPSGDLPVNRCLHGCWWTSDGELTLFGGQTTGVTALDDRWVLQPDTAWMQVEGERPEARNLYAHARTGDATLVFGGQALDGSRLDDAWLLADGASDATRVETDGTGPPGRSGAEMLADPVRERYLVFGGLGTDGPLADTWQLTGDLPRDE